MAFKNIEQEVETKYEGSQFVDEDSTIYSATFVDRFGLTKINGTGLEIPLNIYTKDLPKMIKVLQAVYDKYAEDNSSF